MVDLLSALDSHELIVLRVISEWLELDLTGMKHLESVKALVPLLSELDLRLEMSYLPIEESRAFEELINSGGRISVAAFERQYGSIREMGPGKLEREEPWLDPVSPTEALWYRGFLFRGFLEADDGQLAEYYYLPKEYLTQFPEALADQHSAASDKLRPVDSVSIDPSEIVSAPTDAVDDITGLLAHSQLYPIRQEDLPTLKPHLLNQDADRLSMLYHICWDLKLFRATDEGARPARAAVSWLKLRREEQLRQLIEGWAAGSWNELAHTPGLVLESIDWPNNPLQSRSTLLGFLPENTKWYSVNDFCSFVKQANPDFQRPDGRYDDWYIRDQDTGAFLKGFENWNQVEGRLLRRMISGPLHWLGMVELYQAEDSHDSLFRLSERALTWFMDKPPKKMDVSIPIVVNNSGSIVVSPDSSRYDRFQVARICTAQPPVPGKPFIYWLTPGTLSLAREQGIETRRMVEFLEQASERKLPPGIRRALERWAEQGVEGRLEKTVVLRVKDAEILQKLRENPKTRPFISEALGDLAAAVRPSDWRQLRQAAAQIGLLLDAAMDED